MGRGKKTRQLDSGWALPRNRGKETHYRCPPESYMRPVQDAWGTTISFCNILLPAIFLYGYIKLAETSSTILGGATAMIRLTETIFRNYHPT